MSVNNNWDDAQAFLLTDACTNSSTLILSIFDVDTWLPMMLLVMEQPELPSLHKQYLLKDVSQ